MDKSLCVLQLFLYIMYFDLFSNGDHLLGDHINQGS